MVVVQWFWVSRNMPRNEPVVNAVPSPSSSSPSSPRSDSLSPETLDLALELNNRAYALYDVTNRYDEAMRWIEESLKVNEKCPFAWDTKGCICMEMGRYDEALSCFDRSISLSPPESTYLRKGQCLLRMERYEEALASFDASLPRVYDEIPSKLGKARAWGGLLRFEEALKMVEECLVEEPGHHEVLVCQADLYALMHRWREALVLYERTFEYSLFECRHEDLRMIERRLQMSLLAKTPLPPGDLSSLEPASLPFLSPQCLYWSGLCCLYDSNPALRHGFALYCNAARDAVDEFLTHNPPLVLALFSLKLCVLCGLGRFEEAVECSQRFPSSNVEFDSSFLAWRGVSRMGLGDFDAAMSDFRSSLRLNSTHLVSLSGIIASSLLGGDISTTKTFSEKSCDENLCLNVVFYIRSFGYVKVDDIVRNLVVCESLDKVLPNDYVSRSLDDFSSHMIMSCDSSFLQEITSKEAEIPLVSTSQELSIDLATTLNEESDVLDSVVASSEVNSVDQLVSQLTDQPISSSSSLSSMEMTDGPSTSGDPVITESNASTESSHEVIHEKKTWFVVEKLGGSIISRWQTRHFVLDLESREIRYYKERDRGQPLQSLSLPHAELHFHSETEATLITHSSSRKPEYQLRFLSEGDRELFSRILQSCRESP